MPGLRVALETLSRALRYGVQRRDLEFWTPGVVARTWNTLVSFKRGNCSTNQLTDHRSQLALILDEASCQWGKCLQLQSGLLARPLVAVRCALALLIDFVGWHRV